MSMLIQKKLKKLLSAYKQINLEMLIIIPFQVVKCTKLDLEIPRKS